MNELREWAERVNAIATGFLQSQVLFAANEAGVFAHLEQPVPAENVAAKQGWDARATRMLLNGLVALGLVAKTGETYRNTPMASACLVPGRPGYQGHIISHNRNTAVLWARLDESLRTGAAVSGRDERTPEELRAFILGMSDIAKFSAEEVLKVVDFSRRSRLLDVGGGPATYSIAFVKANPNLKATVFDRPEVIAIAREQVAAARLQDCIDYRQGDLVTDELGRGYDAVFVSNIIHSFGPATNRALVRKCFDALEPGGLLVIKDFLTDDDRSGPPFSLLFALRMLIATGEGDTYSFSEVKGWTQEAGFHNGHSKDISPQTRLWLAEKPGLRREP
ncbi:MAG: methyltransferase [Candidatus Hydrogenedentes bacterium]|nr:methyltransferase [Candidatus Hydrogenedentota bacterium]